MHPSDKQEPNPNYFATMIRGMAMGAADVVPGVSGGTVALVTGIYGRLVNSISHFDRELFRLIREGKWRQVSAHIDLPFLVPLVIGIAIGFAITILTVAKLLHNEQTRAYVLASFLGMIAASAWIVYELIRSNDSAHRALFWPLLFTGILISCGIALMSPSSIHESPPLWYIYVCGTVAICAMILPGISGALILLLLGSYSYLANIPHQLLDGEEVGRSLMVIAVFGLGCGTGLMAFSKFLRRMLQRYPAPTYSLLLGLMLGSLPLLWPFQIDDTPDIEKWNQKHFSPVFPEQVDGRTIGIALVAIAFAAAVIGFFKISKKLQPAQS